MFNQYKLELRNTIKISVRLAVPDRVQTGNIMNKKQAASENRYEIHPLY